MAAVLACGAGAMLSHRAAGAHWGISALGVGDIDVLVPGRRRSSRKGIRIHHVRSFDVRDREVRDGIPVTSVARTLFDLAEVLNPRQLRYAWHRPSACDSSTSARSSGCATGPRGRRGVGTLRELARRSFRASRRQVQTRGAIPAVLRRLRHSASGVQRRHRPVHRRCRVGRRTARRGAGQPRLPQRSGRLRGRPCPRRRPSALGLPGDQDHLAAARERAGRIARIIRTLLGA